MVKTKEKGQAFNIKVYFPDRKCQRVKLYYETISKEIIKNFDVSGKFNLVDRDMYSLVFLHSKYGEKILDDYECPIQLLENVEGEFFKNLGHKIFSRKVTTR